MPRPILALLLAIPTLTHAQTGATDPVQHLIGQPLYLRGDLSADKLAFDATGKPKEAYPTGSPLDAGLEIRKAFHHGDHLQLEGVRVWLTWNKDGTSERSPADIGTKHHSKLEPVSIDIDAPAGEDPTAALAAIFTDKLSDLAPAAPYEWQAFLHTATEPGSKFHAFRCPQQAAAVLAGKPDPSLCPVNVVRLGGAVHPPVTTQQPPPEFSERARTLRRSGDVLVYLRVDEQGNPNNIQIVRPSGLGLEEKAIEAVSQYAFKPAMRDGEPVATELHIDVNFQIF